MRRLIAGILIGTFATTLPTNNLSVDGCAQDQATTPPVGERIALLIEQLGDDSPQVRESATNGLIAIGAPAIPSLKTTEKGADPEVSRRAALAIAIIAVRTRTPLSDGLLRGFPTAYHELASADASRIFALLEDVTQLNERDHPTHRVTDDDLAGIIGELLSDGGMRLTNEQKDSIFRICLGKTIWLLPPRVPRATTSGWHKKVIPASPHIRKLLQDEDPDVRQNALRVLGKLRAKEATADIAHLLQDSQATIRGTAAEILAKLGAKEAVPALKTLAQDATWAQRDGNGLISTHPYLQVIDALADLGDRDALPKVKEYLEFHPRQAMRILAEHDVRDAIADILPLLKSEDEETCCYAIVALSSLKATDAVDGIIAILKDEEWRPDAKLNAMIALKRLNAGEAAACVMRPWLKSEKPRVRGEAALRLGELGAKEAIPDIRPLLNDKDTFARGSAAGALGELGAKETTTDIMRLLDDPDDWVRLRTIDGLEALGAVQAIPRISALLKDRHEGPRGAAVRAIGALGRLPEGQKAREAIPTITTMLDDGDAGVRGASALALASLGTTGAISGIQRLLDDKVSWVRASAAIALVELGAKEKVPMEMIRELKSIASRREEGERAAAALRTIGVPEEEIREAREYRDDDD